MKTPGQVAAMIGRNIVTVHRALLAGEMPSAERLNTGHWVIPDNVAEQWIVEYQARQGQAPAQRLKPRCDAYARKGTGYGRCNKVLDSHGQCPYASDHEEM